MFGVRHVDRALTKTRGVVLIAHFHHKYKKNVTFVVLKSYCLTPGVWLLFVVSRRNSNAFAHCNVREDQRLQHTGSKYKASCASRGSKYA